MSSQFSTYQLGEVAEIIAGGDKPKVFSLGKKASVRVPVLANAEKNNGLMGYTDNARIFEPAVTVAARGSNVGFVAVRKEPFFPVVRLLSLIPKKDRLDVDYLFYNLKQNRKTGTGSGQPQITIPDISSKTIALPPISVQQKVAEVLSVLDQKIELNNRINAELEAMAKNLYDYWFVQFDFPDANGKPYKTSGGKMVYNPTLKRKIPEGWEVASLVDIATFTNGIACQRYFPKEDEAGVYKVIKIREFSSGLDENSDVVIADVPEDLIIQDGDVLFSWSATLDVKLWAGGVGALNQHIFKVTSESYPKTFYYFEVLHYLEHFKMIAALRKTTMGHITKDHLAWSRISLPPRGLIEEMNKKLSPMLEKVISNNQQNMKLTKLRDWLLPMLMNGQVIVE